MVIGIVVGSIRINLKEYMIVEAGNPQNVLKDEHDNRHVPQLSVLLNSIVVLPEGPEIVVIDHKGKKALGIDEYE